MKEQEVQYRAGGDTCRGFIAYEDGATGKRPNIGYRQPSGDPDAKGEFFIDGDLEGLIESAVAGANADRVDDDEEGLADGVHDVLGAGVERVAIRADLDPDRLRGRTDREGGAAADAVHLGLMVPRMNLGLHHSASTTLTRFLSRAAWLNLTSPFAVAKSV